MKKSTIYLSAIILVIASAYLILSTLPISNNFPIFSVFKNASNSTPKIPLKSLNPEMTNNHKPSTTNSINSPNNNPQSTLTSPSPTPTPDPQIYACAPGGTCNSYQDPKAADCPITFKDRYCENKCDDESIQCNY